MAPGSSTVERRKAGRVAPAPEPIPSTIGTCSTATSVDIAAQYGISPEMHAVITQIPGYDPYREAAGYMFDTDEAIRALEFFESCLTHVKGRLAKQPFHLELWEQAIVANLWGWRRKTGQRRYRRSLLYLPKKSGKTPLAAGLLLLALVTDHEPGAEVIGAAAAKEQAGP